MSSLKDLDEDPSGGLAPERPQKHNNRLGLHPLLLDIATYDEAANDPSIEQQTCESQSPTSRSLRSSASQSLGILFYPSTEDHSTEERTLCLTVASDGHEGAGPNRDIRTSVILTPTLETPPSTTGKPAKPRVSHDNRLPGVLSASPGKADHYLQAQQAAAFAKYKRFSRSAESLDTARQALAGQLSLNLCRIPTPPHERAEPIRLRLPYSSTNPVSDMVMLLPHPYSNPPTPPSKDCSPRLRPTDAVEMPQCSPSDSGSPSTVQDSPSLRSEASYQLVDHLQSDAHRLEELQKQIIVPSMLSRRKFATASQRSTFDASTPPIPQAEAITKHNANSLLLSSLAPPTRRRKADMPSPWRPAMAEASKSNPDLAWQPSLRRDKGPNLFNSRDARPPFALQLRTATSFSQAVRPSTANSVQFTDGDSEVAASQTSPATPYNSGKTWAEQPLVSPTSRVPSNESMSNLSSLGTMSSYKLGATFDNYARMKEALAEKQQDIAEVPSSKTSSLTMRTVQVEDPPLRALMRKSSRRDKDRNEAILYPSVDSSTYEVPFAKIDTAPSGTSQQGRGQNNSSNDKTRKPLRWLRGMNSGRTLGTSTSNSAKSGWDDEVIPQTLPLPTPVAPSIGLTQKKKTPGSLRRHPTTDNMMGWSIDGSNDPARVQHRTGTSGLGGARSPWRRV